MKGALYGQRSASLAWHNTIAGWLKDPEVWGAGRQFQQGSNDPCIFVNPVTGLRLVMVVDDILCRGSPEATEAFYKALMKRFDCKDPSYLSEEVPLTYVGFQVRQEVRSGTQYISIDQDEDISRYLTEIEVGACAKVYNPMPDRWEIAKHPNPLTDEDASRYRATVGSLNYYACGTRYDISYPLSRLAQYSARPTVGADRALKRVLQYLKCNATCRLIGEMHNKGDRIEVYSDSDLAGDVGGDCRSQSGSMILLNGVPVYWRSKKQPRTALSSACAEIYALSETLKEARLFMWRAQELGMPLLPLVVQVDNTQAKSFKEGTCINSKLKGNFDMREKWVQELRSKEDLEIKMVTSVNNVSDLLTKAHKTARYKQLMHLIRGKVVVKMNQNFAMIALVRAVGG